LPNIHSGFPERCHYPIRVKDNGLFKTSQSAFYETDDVAHLWSTITVRHRPT